MSDAESPSTLSNRTRLDLTDLASECTDLDVHDPTEPPKLDDEVQHAPAAESGPSGAAAEVVSAKPKRISDQDPRWNEISAPSRSSTTVVIDMAGDMAGDREMTAQEKLDKAKVAKRKREQKRKKKKRHAEKERKAREKHENEQKKN